MTETPQSQDTRCCRSPMRQQPIETRVLRISGVPAGCQRHRRSGPLAGALAGVHLRGAGRHVHTPSSRHGRAATAAAAQRRQQRGWGERWTTTSRGNSSSGGHGQRLWLRRVEQRLHVCPSPPGPLPGGSTRLVPRGCQTDCWGWGSALLRYPAPRASSLSRLCVSLVLALCRNVMAPHAGVDTQVHVLASEWWHPPHSVLSSALPYVLLLCTTTLSPLLQDRDPDQ